MDHLQPTLTGVTFAVDVFSIHVVLDPWSGFYTLRHSSRRCNAEDFELTVYENLTREELLDTTLALLEAMGFDDPR